MNRENAKHILLLHRPGTADEGDPALAEALALLQRDEEMQRWLEVQRATQDAIRRQFKKISPPAGLKEQIISERPWHTRPVTAWHLLATAAVVVGIFALGLWWSGRAPREDKSLAGYRNRMASTAQRAYGMQLATNNLATILAFLKEHGAPGDFVLPARLTQATATGCLTVSWQSNPVAMICFKTGRPLQPGQSSDLWLFVIDQATLPDAPKTETPQIATVNQVTTASWTRLGKTYVLAVEGNEALLRKYL
jgi:hypothetical protein